MRLPCPMPEEHSACTAHRLAPFGSERLSKCQKELSQPSRNPPITASGHVQSALQPVTDAVFAWEASCTTSEPQYLLLFSPAARVRSVASPPSSDQEIPHANVIADGRVPWEFKLYVLFTFRRSRAGEGCSSIAVLSL